MKNNNLDIFGYIGIALAILTAVFLMVISNNHIFLYLGVFLFIISLYYTFIVLFFIENRSEKTEIYFSESQVFAANVVKPNKKRKSPTPISGKCGICNESVMMPYRCSYCDRTFCSKHRLPENHECDGLKKKN